MRDDVFQSNLKSINKRDIIFSYKKPKNLSEHCPWLPVGVLSSPLLLHMSVNFPFFFFSLNPWHTVSEKHQLCVGLVHCVHVCAVLCENCQNWGGASGLWPLSPASPARPQRQEGEAGASEGELPGALPAPRQTAPGPRTYHPEANWSTWRKFFRIKRHKRVSPRSLAEGIERAHTEGSRQLRRRGPGPGPQRGKDSRTRQGRLVWRLLTWDLQGTCRELFSLFST